MEHEVAVEIAASPERVWEVLADIERWSEWTPSITSAQKLDDGRYRVKQPRFPAAVWTVTSWEPAKGFSWTARSGGVTTVADHELQPGAGDGAGATTVTLRIRQTGPMAGVVALLFGSRARRYVQQEADGLKRQSEAGSAA